MSITTPLPAHPASTQPATGNVLNISAYLFVALDNCEALRDAIHTQAAGLGLKGTVLLASEGINLFLAGPSPAVRAMVAWLQQDSRLRTLAPKESHSDRIPFAKLLVKVKGEIIRMNHPTIKPQDGRAPAVERGFRANLHTYLTAGSVALRMPEASLVW